MALWSAPNAGPGHMSHHALNRATAVVSPAARDLWFKCFVTPHCGQSMARTLPFSVVWNPMPRSGLSQLCFGATTRGGGGGAAAADSGSCSCSSASRCAFALTNVRARNSVRVPQFQTHVKTSHNEPYYTNGSTLFGVTMSSKTFAGSMSLSCISMSGPSSPSSPSSSQSCRGIGSMACHTRYSKMTHGSMPTHTCTLQTNEGMCDEPLGPSAADASEEKHHDHEWPLLRDLDRLLPRDYDLLPLRKDFVRGWRDHDHLLLPPLPARSRWALAATTSKCCSSLASSRRC